MSQEGNEGDSLTATGHSRLSFVRDWLPAFGFLAAVAASIASFMTFSLNREQQAAEQFGRAVDQLAQDDLSIRLGGVYALGALMHDSKDDAPAAIDVLCTFIRTHRTKVGSTPIDTRLPADIVAALKVLGDRPNPRYLNHKLDLSDTWLQGADLRRVKLKGAYLKGSVLNGAHLNNADLRDTDLSGADLRNARLCEADLRGATLGDGAELNEARLKNADLSGVDLQKADLDGPELVGAILSGTKLPEGKGLPSPEPSPRSCD